MISRIEVTTPVITCHYSNTRETLQRFSMDPPDSPTTIRVKQLTCNSACCHVGLCKGPFGMDFFTKKPNWGNLSHLGQFHSTSKRGNYLDCSLGNIPYWPWLHFPGCCIYSSYIVRCTGMWFHSLLAELYLARLA
jgi:hypothetical protein